MKHHPAWLAAGLLVFVVLACHLSTNSNRNGNSNSNSNANSSAISKITMAKDNGKGEPGDETNTFSPRDHKIHCLITLKEPKEGTKVTFGWWIVDAGGTTNEKIKELDYTTESDLVEVVHGNLSLTRNWPSGKYKVEAQINGKLEKTVNFVVE
jgi:hypothetical protein